MLTDSSYIALSGKTSKYESVGGKSVGGRRKTGRKQKCTRGTSGKPIKKSKSRRTHKRTKT